MQAMDNRLFYLCSLIEYMGRDTKNKRHIITGALGKENARHIYEYADVFHCEAIESVSDQWRSRCDIQTGGYDNVSTCRYRLPSHWDIGKVYCRLIHSLGGDTMDTLFEVYSSWIAPKIDDYNIAVYFMSPEYLLASYKSGNLLDE
jgi:hypothetical protein